MSSDTGWTDTTTLSPGDTVEVVHGSGRFDPAFDGMTGRVVATDHDFEHMLTLYEQAANRDHLRSGAKYGNGSPMIFGPVETIDLYLDVTYKGPYVEVEFSRDRAGFYPVRNLVRVPY